MKIRQARKVMATYKRDQDAGANPDARYKASTSRQACFVETTAWERNKDYWLKVDMASGTVTREHHELVSSARSA